MEEVCIVGEKKVAHELTRIVTNAEGEYPFR